jgi:hypothetical protein
MHTNGTDTAMACFQEATRQIDRNANPADWNVANGMANLTYALQRMESEIETLRREVAKLSQK